MHKVIGRERKEGRKRGKEEKGREQMDSNYEGNTKPA
jgi:hypothetical protein